MIGPMPLVRHAKEEQRPIVSPYNGSLASLNLAASPFMQRLLITLLFLAFISACATAHARDEKPRKPHILFIACEDEYDAKNTLPAFAKELNKGDAYKITTLTGNEKKTDIPGLDALDSADLLVLYFRRTTLPEDQLKKFKAYFESGKPTLAIRTSSHGFQNWLEFDRTVLGATYGNHYGNKADGTEISFDEKQSKHAILAGVEQKPFHSPMWVYKYTDLADSVTVLMSGKFKDKVEPVTWTNVYKGGRVFYTSLGHQEDFKNAVFTKMLTNAVTWCLTGK